MNMDWLLDARAEILHRAADRAQAARLPALERRLRGRETAMRFEAGRRWDARRQAAPVRSTPAARTPRSVPAAARPGPAPRVPAARPGRSTR